MGGGQMETPARGQAQPGLENRFATAAGTSEIAPSEGHAKREATNHRESADDYRFELFRLRDYRVAACHDGLQWLYQRRDPAKALAGARWRTLGYCVTRAALERLQRENLQPESREIAALPERFRRERGQT